MTLARATLSAVGAGVVVTLVYQLFETVEPRDDLWFAGIAAGFGLVTVPIAIDLAATEVLGRLVGQEEVLLRIRRFLVGAGASIGLFLVGWVSLRAGADPYVGAAFVLLPILIFVLGVVALVWVVVAAVAARTNAAQ